MKYKDKWNDKHYDRVFLRVPKGMKEEIKKVAHPRSINEYINEAIKEKMER